MVRLNSRCRTPSAVSRVVLVVVRGIADTMAGGWLMAVSSSTSSDSGRMHPPMHSARTQAHKYTDGAVQRACQRPNRLKPRARATERLLPIATVMSQALLVLRSFRAGLFGALLRVA